MNSELFWDGIRNSIFNGKITHGAFNTVNAIVDTYYAEYINAGDPEHMAYILATAYHESYHTRLNPEWRPVREGFAKTNAGAIAAVTKLYNEGRIRSNYAKVQPNGKSYYGRGYVQITHGYNYMKMGGRLGLPLYENPDLALEPIPAAKILVIGSVEGLFTGKRLSDFDTADDMLDAYNARRVINGLDRAALISEYYEKFHLAITRAISA